MANIVPRFSFAVDVLPESETAPLESGQYQGIHFTILDPSKLDWLLAKFEQWFEERDEVILVDHGTTVSGMGFIVMEWEECQIDPLFIDILKHEEMVDDLSIYLRDEEA